MKVGGYITLAIGAVISAGALFLMDTTVSMPSSLLGDVRSTHNIGLLQQQQLIVHLGFTLMIVGAIFAAAGSAMERRSVATVSSEAPPAAPAAPVYVNDTFAADGKVLGILAAVIIVIVAIFMVLRPSPSAEELAIQRNADDLANQMELQADNLDAMADRLERQRR